VPGTFKLIKAQPQSWNSANSGPPARTWIPGFTYVPTPAIPINPSTVAFVSLSSPGVVTYCLVNQLELESAALGAVAGAISQLQVDFGVATLETAMAF
jgi:hypothetical protein